MSHFAILRVSVGLRTARRYVDVRVTNATLKSGNRSTEAIRFRRSFVRRTPVAWRGRIRYSAPHPLAGAVGRPSPRHSLPIGVAPPCASMLSPHFPQTTGNVPARARARARAHARFVHKRAPFTLACDVAHRRYDLRGQPARRDSIDPPARFPAGVTGLKGIGTSQTSKYVFGVFTYLSYRFHTHMNNRGAYYYRFDKILHLIQRAEASRGNVFYNELGDHVSRVEVYVLPAIGITC